MTVQGESRDGILTVTLDDGARNALTPDVFAALVGVLDAASEDDLAIVVQGRPGVLSAGLDLKWMARGGPDEIRALLGAFGRALMRLWTEPRPTVCAATGHAVAAGTMLSMACDHTVAADGDFVWGLTETRIGLQMPAFGLALCRHNVPADRLEDLVLPGRAVDPTEAVAAGFADELAAPDDVTGQARAVATRFAELPAAAYAGTKQRLRGRSAAVVLDGLDDDVASLTAGLPRST